MNKEDLINDIIESIIELNGLSDESGTLFLHGDNEDLLFCTVAKGNVKTIATTFSSKMRTNADFNRIMMSSFGAYLSAHQEEKDKFIGGLQLTDFPLSMN